MGRAYTGLAQLVEHWSPKPGVGSSSLSARAKHRKMNLVNYIKDSFEELRNNVTWISWEEAQKSTVGRAAPPRYPETLKKTGVVGLYNRQESAQSLAEKLGVCRPTLYNWKNQLLGSEAPAIMKRKNNSQPVPEREELERQLETLQHDIQKLQLEHDLLKKATELIKKTLTRYWPACARYKHTVLYCSSEGSCRFLIGGI